MNRLKSLFYLACASVLWLLAQLVRLIAPKDA